MDDSDRVYEFRKKIKMLSKYRGSGTQLISVYIPKDYPIHEISGKLRDELGQASNIKSKSTKLNVSSALEKLINNLKMYNKTPPNGICMFCGNVSENPSKIDVQLFSIEPIFPLKMNIYRCDSKFFLEPLIEMIENQDSYGIVVLDGKEATIAFLKGTEITIIKKLNSTAHSKIRKGGQSSRRFERLREESIDKYYIRVGEAMDSAFVGKGIKGVIVGGPGPTKDYFMKAKTFNYQLNVLGVVDTGYTEEYGIREVLAKSSEIISEQAIIKEKILVERFIKEVVQGGLATYGINEVQDAILIKKADHVLVSEGLTFRRIGYKCSSCSNEEFDIIGPEAQLPLKNCPKCNTLMQIEEDDPLTDYFIELARTHNIKVDVISNGSAEGNQFFSGFGGIGAFLRYK
ncbi:MAG: peptide chain release factor aRF-1 [Candidatus Micrarchaeia archaeon]